MTTLENTKHLGIFLGRTIYSTVAVTMAHIKLKAIKRYILAITPPTDILHIATLINVTLLPVNNHVIMALPVEPEHTEELDKEVLSFLWTKQVDGQAKQKRRLVAKKRVSAGLEMGNLGIPHTESTELLG
jgi:hypothetical protein